MPRHVIRAARLHAYVISTVHVRPTINLNGTIIAGIIQYLIPGFRMLRREYLGFGVSELGISPYVESSLFPCQCVLRFG